ncbi:MAG: amino acid adenylation domain-containing protein, partial [Prevotellaceae bacterium]|nr:amino acid adenylation domain-containing protein [Prevotellaceae bacterium]
MTKTLDAKPTDAATLVQLFEQQAAKTPSAVALIAEDATFTYAELNARANRLAHELIRRGVQVEDKVALILPRDSRVVVSMYGIMKAGGAFIPIDPEYPQGRIAHYLSDSAARYVLTDKATAGAYPNAIEVDALLAASKNEANPNLPLSGRNLCYVIYTSGSTGVPKGVLLEHRGLVSCARCSEKNISVFKGVEHDVNAVCITTVSFDVFLLTLFAVLSNGQRFILANDEEAKNPLPMAALIKRTKGNYLCGTTARLMEYLEYPEIREVAAGCKLIIQGGEKFPPALYEKLRAATSADIINAYGPTEVSIESNEKILASANLITVGAPLRDVVELIVSEAGEPLPPGVEGELWIGGPRVSRGYLNRPELNAERFVERDGVRYYKSGDKAKWTDDGEVIILGRNDNQIKLRGLRIELGEIENALAAVPGVKQGVVLVRTSRKQEHLCAWFTANRPIAAEELRAALSETLTAYMVPTAYMQLGEMPHTPNGKIDAKALPDITMKAAEVVPPVTDMQKAVFSIVADVLGSSEGLGITTELVFVGMTSLDATRIAAVITRQTGKKIGMVDVMNAKTIGRVATFLESAGQEAALQQLEQLDEYPLTQNQMGLYYECARRPNATMYNLPMEFSLLPRTDVARLEAALKATLAAHPYLNTYIKEKDGKPMQMRNDRAPAVVETCKASEEEYQKAKADFIVPFDLLHAPLYRLKIYQTPQAVYLLTDFHHIIFDGWSMGVFLSDLSRAFAGEALAPETFTAFDHALLEQRVDRTAQMEDDRKWYTALLGDGEGSTQLPADHESAQRGAQRELNAFLDPEFVDGAYRLHGTTGAPFFLAALSLLVSRFAGVRQVRLATVSAGRDSASLQDNMGMLVVTLPVVVDVPAEEAVDSFIDRVQARLRETLSRQAYPASRLFTDLQCLPQIVYAYQGAIIGHDVLDEQPLNMVELRPENPDFPLFVGISRERDKYKVKIEYDEALFERDTVQNILDSFVHVVHLLADTANRPRPLCELAVATQEQQRQIASFMK